ncbi:MAG: MCE family protein [Desulfarculus sp.]|nr:MCE family protein [Desulfarculus sp.]
MSRQASKFKVGLFVLAGIFTMLVALVWLGATRYLKGTSTYVTYFSESVQGLQVDSVVKYRGVEIGRVKAIQVAPDNILIEVVMGIHYDGAVPPDITATLKMVGITGIAYIELDRKPPETPDQAPKLTFAARYPVIPSRPSEISQLFSLVEEVVRQIRSINFKTLADDLQGALAAAREVLSGVKINKTVESLEKAAANLESLTGRVDRYLARGELEATVTQAKNALAEAQGLMVDLRQEVKSLDLSSTRERTDQVIEQVQDRVAQVGGEARVTADNLRRASETLERLLSRLENSPSDVLFSQPPAAPGGRPLPAGRER